MAVNDPLVFIREQSRSMFPDGVVSGSVLMSNIAFGAAALGAGHIEICNSGEWWFAASETNWLERDLTEKTKVEDLFSTRVRFPKLGPSSYRPELYVGAFAEDIYLDLNGRYIEIKGRIPTERPHVSVVPPWCVYVLSCRVAKDRS